MINVDKQHVKFSGTGLELCADLRVLYIALLKDDKMNAILKMAIATLDDETIDELTKNMGHIEPKEKMS